MKTKHYFFKRFSCVKIYYSHLNTIFSPHVIQLFYPWMCECFFSMFNEETCTTFISWSILANSSLILLLRSYFNIILSQKCIIFVHWKKKPDPCKQIWTYHKRMRTEMKLNKQQILEEARNMKKHIVSLLHCSYFTWLWLEWQMHWRQNFL